MSTFNPACYLPTAVSNYLPSSLACPPPPSYFTSVYNTLTSPFGSTYTTLRTMLNAIVSLPMLSFLLIPTMSSYSTSLNLLFFYLTWSTLVLSHPPLRVEIVATLAVRILFYIIPSTFFLIFDFLIPSAAESMKSQSFAGLPLHRASRAKSLAVLRMVSWSLANTVLAVLAQAAIEIFLVKGLETRSALRVTTTLPLPFGIIKDLVKGYLLREVLTYTIHRYVLHESTSQLATQHNEWYHTIPAPFPLSATYDHPAAYLLRSFVPTFVPAMVFRFHLLTYVLYVALLSLEETFAYSGYSTVPTNFVLGGIARRTDAHVICNGEGNYGCFGLMDWVFGTSVGSEDLQEDLELEAEKHDVQRRVQRVGRRGVDGARKRLVSGVLGGDNGTDQDGAGIVGRIRRKSAAKAGIGAGARTRMRSRS